jgi:hypothetical protein
MRLPFSTDEFFAVFERYNSDVWPIQLLIYALAGLTVIALVRKMKEASQMINQLLAVLWLWMGVMYHLKYFSSINPAAYFFAAMFIVQGLIFGYLSVGKSKLEYRFRFNTLRGLLGVVFIVYGLILYPVLNELAGVKYPSSPTFGLPCPTTIFTFGLLVMATKKIPWFVFLIPFLWSLIGFSAALTLSVEQDLALGIAGIISLLLILFGKTVVVTGRPQVT